MKMESSTKNDVFVFNHDKEKSWGALLIPLILTSNTIFTENKKETSLTQSWATYFLPQF